MITADVQLLATFGQTSINNLQHNGSDEESVLQLCGSREIDLAKLRGRAWGHCLLAS